MDRFDPNENSDRPRGSPSYFRNVVSLGADSLPKIPTPRISSPRISSIKKINDSTTGFRDESNGSSSRTFGESDKNNTTTRHDRLIPLASPVTNSFNPNNGQDGVSSTANVRSRKGNGGANKTQRGHTRGRRRRRKQHSQHSDGTDHTASCCCPRWCFGRTCGGIFWCCNDRKIVRSTLSCMNVVARILSWCTVVASVAGVVWYSYELKKTGKEDHLILWNSAAAFVLIGFPISIYGIVMHLANYNQPETQNYIVRILWMVPIFSIQSWLGLRFKDYSIYFETVRDMYEAYVLYSFLQFLIQVLGGEEALILMLKDKSPTRGVHYGGLQLCVKPWLMGQPVRKTVTDEEGETLLSGGTTSAITASETLVPGPVGGQQHLMNQPVQNQPLKRVYWTSPFFLYCKFGVFQYVLLKFLSTIAILLLEPHGLYKEGSFSYKGGYLYICILTNFSQTWALYCFFFFYFATKNELTPIRPVGKFVSVKLLVFFTWWQSLFISILYQMELIPHYSSAEATLFGFGGSTENDLGGIRSEPDWSAPLSAEDATALDQYGGKAFWDDSATGRVVEYSAEDVAKAIQDYLICIEMFFFAIVHIFVFPHSEYSPEAVDARASALNQRPNKNWNKRLGRKWKEYDNKSAWSATTSSSRNSADIELYPLTGGQRNYIHDDHNQTYLTERKDSMGDDDLRFHPTDTLNETESQHFPLLEKHDEESSSESGSYEEDDEFPDYPNGMEANQAEPRKKKNFFSALLDSSIPQDLRDNTVGIIKGDYVVERKTLLHHAATSDSYDLLSRMSRPKKPNIPSNFKG